MANNAHGHTDTGAHAGHSSPSVRDYARIFFILFVITMVEVGASFLNPELGMPQWFEIVVLIVLSVLKGVLVVMFYMHLRFDSRWFVFLFTSGIILATFGLVVLLVLFSYHRGVVG